MSLQYPLWKLFVAAAAVAILFAVARPRPEQVVPFVATFVTAVGLVGLILLGNRGNIGTIRRSIAWSLAGAFFGTALSPSPPLHPPLDFLFYGTLIGWVLGVVLEALRRKN